MLVQDIAKRVSVDQQDWPLYLSEAVWSSNVQIHAATGYSPFMLMTGRDPQVGVDTALLDSKALRKLDLSDQAIQQVQRLQKANAELRKKQEDQFQRMRKYYDEGRKEADFVPGQKVLLWNPKIRVQPGQAKKLAAKYDGPWTVIQLTGVGGSTAIIRNVANPRRSERVSVQRLRHFVARKEDWAVQLEENEFEVDDIVAERESPEKPGTKEYQVIKTGHSLRDKVWIHQDELAAPDLLAKWNKRKESKGEEEDKKEEEASKEQKIEEEGKQKEPEKKKEEKQTKTRSGRKISKPKGNQDFIEQFLAKLRGT